MTSLKKVIACMIVLSLCLPSFGIVQADTVTMNTSLQNCGFENPDLSLNGNGSNYYQFVHQNSIPDWNTTAYEGKIEILVANNKYISNYMLLPREGIQAAELNADEQSSLFQSINTTPGSFVKWGISHHGRNGYDTMLLVIGPKQDVDPAKKTKNSLDQFMKIGDYIKGNSNLSKLIPTGAGASQEIVLYSPKFAENGDFVTGETANFTTYRTVSNTEEWHVWFIKSNNDRWYDYGTNVTTDTDALGYNNLYEVPEGQTETTFAFTAYECAPRPEGRVDLTYGNIIDGINFGLLHNVSVRAMQGGDASITSTLDKAVNVSYKGVDFASKKYKADSLVTLNAIADSDADYLFVGASINDTDYKYNEFDYDSTNGVYTKDIIVDEAKYAKVVFARKGHIVYNPNGGMYQGTSAPTDKEYGYYTNGVSEKEVPSNESAVFSHWTLYTRNNQYLGTAIPAEHTVTYNADNADKPTLTINWRSNNEDKSITLPAKKEEGIVLLANYSYRHEAIVLTEGGSVQIHNNTREMPVTGDGQQSVTTGEEGDIIKVIAAPKEGYQFDGWFESEEGTPISKALEYSYAVTGNSKIYAKYSVAVEEEIKPDDEEDKKPDYVIPSFDTDYSYIFGYTDSIMAPENNVTRGEVSAMLYRLVKQNNKLGGFTYVSSEPADFEDIQGTWYRSAIEYMTYKNAFNKDERFVFPEQHITRGETFKLVCLGLGFTTDDTLTVSDYGNILKDAGAIEGYEDGSLRLEDILTRAQFCTMYNRVIGRDKKSLLTADGEKITAATYGFTDLEEDKWYYEDVLKATSAYDEDGNVDLAKRGVRNSLDDYVVE